MYFYENLFNSPQNSQICLKKPKLKKNTIETILNELFSLNTEENEEKMIDYVCELGIEIS